MELKDITVRPDWQVLEAREAAERVRLAERLQLVIAAAGIVMLALALWPSAPSQLRFALPPLFAATFILLPLWALIRREPAARITLMIAGAVLFVSTSVAAFTTPLALRSSAGAQLPALPPLAAVAVPLLNWGLLFWAQKRHPGLLHGLGFGSRHVASQALIGAALGAALGFHFWAATTALPGPHAITSPTAAGIAWIAITAVGLRSLGEELALRGVLYRLYATGTRGAPKALWLRVIALSLPLYVVPALNVLNPLLLLVALLYGLLFAILATFLRQTLRSAIAPLAANVIFNLLFTLASVP